MSAYVQEDPAGGFERSRELFESLVSAMRDPAAGELTHADLEDQLAVSGRELTCALLQDHLDLRALRENRKQVVVDADGTARTRVESGHERVLGTVFGQVRVTRMAYRAPGVSNLHPEDAVLNLPGGKHSHGLRRLAAVEAVRGSFADAGDATWRATGVRVGKRQVEELTRAAAADVEEFYEQSRPAPSPPGEVLVLSADGKGVVMRPEGLREATRRAAKTGGHKLSTRLSRGEKRDRKRMAEVAAVYDITPSPRTADDIIIITTAGTGAGGGQTACATTAPPPPSPGPRPGARGKWLTAGLTRTTAQVIAAMFDEAERRDPEHARPWVALVDGNPHQIQRIHAEAQRRGIKVTVIVDFVHVMEYIWRAAWCFYAEGDTAVEQWVARHARRILAGDAATVAAAIRRKATRTGLEPSRRKAADTTAKYLLNKKAYPDYPTALTAGWPIGTGIIEDACSHLVKDRMDITGARWGLDGAEAILRLRALSSNGDFDAYWTWHLDREHHRTHRTHYKDQVLAA